LQKFARKKKYETGEEFVIFSEFDKLPFGIQDIAKIPKEYRIVL